MSPNRQTLSTPHRQQGFLIPLALFILVGMLALALAASRLTGQSSTSATLELMSTHAFYAAESGGQYGMHVLFFNVPDQAAADGKCNTLATTLNFAGSSAAGLQSCQADVSCVVTSTSGTSFYTVTSAGSCGTGEMSAQRTIEISAFME